MSDVTRPGFFIVLFCFILIPFAWPVGSSDDSASTSPRKDTSSGIEITDVYGRIVALDAPARRIVSLSPGTTETVFALGYGAYLVGRTSFCDFPPEAAAVPDVGNLMEPDFEALVAAAPDLVVASTHFPEEALDRLESSGLTVAVLMGQDSFEGVYNGVIRPLAILLGDPEAGESLVALMEAVVSKATAHAESFPRKPTVYYAVGFGEGGDWTAGGDTFIGEMIEKAGGRNVAGDVKGWSFSVEALIARDPDVVILPGWAGEAFASTPPYSVLRAVREGRAIALDENTIVRQGPRLAEGFASLVDAIGTAFE